MNKRVIDVNQELNSTNVGSLLNVWNGKLATDNMQMMKMSFFSRQDIALF